MIRRVLAVRGQMGFAVDVAPRFDYALAPPRGHAYLAWRTHPFCRAHAQPPNPLSAGDRQRRRRPRPHRRPGRGDRPPSCWTASSRASSRSRTPMPTSLRRSTPPWRSGGDGCAAHATAGAGGRWCTARRSHSSCSPTRPPARSWPPPRRACRNRLAVYNWDYRYTWMRDAAFTLYALLRLGFTEEAGAFMNWLAGRFRQTADRETGPLQVMYGIDGRECLPEEELTHLEGYMGSAPVRIGNRAATQLQMDIYGELMDSVYLCNKYGLPIYHDGWMELTRNLEWLMEHWDQPDEGIWETRGGRRNYTYSRLMSWVAVERAIRVARQRGLPADIPRWGAVRDRIYHQIMECGWNPARRAFVQHYDTNVLDASLLLMPLCKFVAPTDPRWISTLDAITAKLVSDSLVYRYNVPATHDGLAGEEATFSMCSFWWVEALARAGRLDEARLAFEKMLTYANHVGLYSEEIGPTGEQLGNFPRALTHLALISAAYNLDRELG
ncbi:MAG: glycoside hydrolase family 15 protein [Mycobacterium sp.]